MSHFLLGHLLPNSPRRRSSVLREFHALQTAGGTPLVQDAEELDGPGAVGAGEKSIRVPELTLVVVVPGRTLGIESLGDFGLVLHLGQPGLFGFEGGLDPRRALLASLIEDIGHVLGLHLQGMRHVHGEGSLSEAQEKAVRETVGLEAVQGAPAVGPLVAEGEAVATDDVVARPAGVAGTDLEAGGEDDAVDRVLGTANHNAVLRDTLDPLAVGVDQCHVRPVEARQVFIVEARPLTELPVPRLEGFGSNWIVNDVFGPRADLIHLLEVDHLHELALLPRGEASAQLTGGGFGGDAGKVAEDLGPAVADEILFLVATVHQDVEVVHAPLLPTRLKAFGPFRVGLMVVAHVDRRWRTLEYIQVLGPLADNGECTAPRCRQCR